VSNVKKRKKKTVEQRAADIVAFIEANGGKLGPYRAYRVSPETPGEMSPLPAPESTEEPSS